MSEDQLVKKYGQRLPQAWYEMSKSHFFDIYHQNHLQLSDLIWMKPEEMHAWVYPTDTIDGIMPFAHTRGMMTHGVLPPFSHPLMVKIRSFIVRWRTKSLTPTHRILGGSFFVKFLRSMPAPA